MVLPKIRKSRRFALRYCVHLKFSAQGKDSEFDGVTRDLSLRGVLFESPSRISENCTVNFRIVAEGKPMLCPLEFAGTGCVTRV